MNTMTRNPFLIPTQKEKKIESKINFNDTVVIFKTEQICSYCGEAVYRVTQGTNVKWECLCVN